MRVARVGLLASIIVAGLPGCAGGPIRTGAPHLDKALAAVHEAGFPGSGRETSRYGPAADKAKIPARYAARYRN